MSRIEEIQHDMLGQVPNFPTVIIGRDDAVRLLDHLAAKDARIQELEAALEFVLKSPADRLKYCEERGLLDKSKNDIFETWTHDEHWIKQIARAALNRGKG